MERKEIRQAIFDIVFDKCFKSDMGDSDPYIDFDKDQCDEVVKPIMELYDNACKQTEAKTNALIDDLFSKRKLIEEIETFLEKIGQLAEWRGY